MITTALPILLAAFFTSLLINTGSTMHFTAG